MAKRTKKKPLIDPDTIDNVTHLAITPVRMTEIFDALAKSARTGGAGCVSASFRFDEGKGVGDGEYIPELMLRVRKP